MRRLICVFFTSFGLLAWHSADALAADPFDRSGSYARGDFDGDDEIDVAVGSPETNCNKGAVYVTMGSGGSTSWTEDTSGVLGVAGCDDYFGAALATGDFNDDGFDDLAVGTPGGADSGYSASGSVHLLYGSSTGLTATGDQVWHQDSSGIEGVAEVGDLLGSALAVGDFNCDGYDDLAVGTPGEAVGSIVGAGAVNVIFGSSSGLSTLDSIWYQGAGGVDGAAETNDYFGAALAAGNFNGDLSGTYACSDLAIGAPNEDQSSTVIDSGYVYIIDGSASGLSSTGDQGVDQNVTNVADVAQTDDQLGFRLEVVDLDGDQYDDLWATVPGDGCATSAGWGRHTFHGSSGGLSFSNDVVDCDPFACEVEVERYICREPGRIVQASAGADDLRFLFGADIAFGWGGADELNGSLGSDILFGGAGADVFDGGAGADILVGGSGDDSFQIDLDCDVHADDVVDGGPGTDTVYSHLSQSELLSAGVMLVSIENFVTVPEQPREYSMDCAGFPYEGFSVKPTDVTLTWDELPLDTTILTSTTGVLTLDVVNERDVTRTVTIRYVLLLGGDAHLIEESSATLDVRESRSFTLDLSDFIPAGVDPGSMNPAVFIRPSSSVLLAIAAIEVNGETVEYAYAPTLWGHVHDASTVKIYRKGALMSTYYGGDLSMWRGGATGSPAYSGSSEAWGVVP